MTNDEILSNAHTSAEAMRAALALATDLWTASAPSALDQIRDDSGKLPAYAWPGGYPIAYTCSDGESLCASDECANGPEATEATADPTDSSGWRIVGYAYDHEETVICAHCGAVIYEEEEPEPEEDDWTTTDHEHFYQSGKCVLTVPEGADYRAAVLVAQERAQWWPSVWFISDHGNAHLIKFDATD